jgi:putative glutamine amidotransferase
MANKPIILISPNVEKKGDEFGDMSTSVSETYQQALLEAGAVPIAMPATVDPEVIAAAVNCADGILLTGGEDVDPSIYGQTLRPALAKTVHVTPDGGRRDLRELMLINEVFRQRKPLLAICRGHQVLNVALGGTLIADVRTEVKGALDHRQMARRSEVVHEVRLTGDSILAKIAAGNRLGVNSTHHQAIGEVAEPLRITAESSDGIIEGMELKQAAADLLPFLLSVQFHPERLAPKHREHRAIFEAFSRACQPNRRR